MVYKVYDPVLVEINSIKDLSLVKFYDLTLSEDNRQVLVPALLVSHSNGKYFNLSIRDKYFNEFVKKVIKVYHEEKDDLVSSDLFSSSDIIFDSYTKTILENGGLSNRKEITEFYDNKDFYNHSFTFQSDEIKSIFDIVRYEIMSFGDFANYSMELLNDFRGYRTNYVMEANINGIFTYLLAQYDKLDDNNYQVSIGNLGGLNNNFFISIHFLDDAIDIVCSYKNFVFNDLFTINSKKGSYLRRIAEGDRIIKFDTGNLEKVDPKEKNLINLDYDSGELTWYLLPWSSYIGHKEIKEVVTKDKTISGMHTIYLDVNQDNFFKRDFFTKKVYSDSKASRLGVTLTLDEMRKTTYGYKSGPYFIIETGFKDADGDGVYQERFNGKYYYHIVRADNLDEIERNNLISARKEIINSSSDLLLENKIKSLGGNL